ncbi:mandelate racemase/muconate lactonizing enzyme family protein [Microvirga sp. VF16]|uniref:mandelate racemase/muconate lactonizing enzyme family protein n=1 Tax=Microvirga sp. VF16 TaxID=2807101 RepID=UPI00193CE6D1|nr:mandelate racemase/muconate lactonizing enzyme family protein [Microvirga sp. VF16]QRM32565.1 mandelate racemase/muconate lactonizing enzyme family protein [Microvirga sp. VF16]
MNNIITRVTATPVLVPVIVGESARWFRREHLDRTILEIETADGILGLGEARGLWPAEIISERFAPLLLGSDASDHDGLRRRCLKPLDFGFPERHCDTLAYAAIDLALWDIAGKMQGKPLYELLGGAVRERAEFGAFGYPPNPDEGFSEKDVPRVLAKQAEKAIEDNGTTYFEFKIARYRSHVDIPTIRAVRKAVGDDFPLAVDANQTYDEETAAEVFRQVAEQRLDNFEEPVRSLAGIDRLAKAFGVKVSSHCVDADVFRALPNITASVPDICIFGNLSALMRHMEAMSQMGRGTWLRAMWELGISWAAMCHVGISSSAISRPSQALIDYAEDDLIMGEPWSVRGGGVKVPAVPGLGIELDRRALEKYRADN